MARKRKGPNRYWTKEEKLVMVLRVVKEYESTLHVSKDMDISNGLLNNWIKKYREHGEKGLENCKRPGNPLARYANRNHLTDIEALQYENMKLYIENERLKKGYLVKGDGSVVIFKK